MKGSHVLNRVNYSYWQFRFLTTSCQRENTDNGAKGEYRNYRVKHEALK